MLDLYEISSIQRYDSLNNGYNNTSGGEGRKNSIVTIETRKKISELVKGENNPNYNNKWSDEQKLNLSLKKKGKKTGQENPRATKIIRIEDLKVYNTIKEASIDICAKNQIGITRCLKNNSFVANGFHYCIYDEFLYKKLKDDLYRFDYLCKCCSKSKSIKYIADISNMKILNKSQFIKYINKTYNITTRTIRKNIEENKEYIYGNNKFISLN